MATDQVQVNKTDWTSESGCGSNSAGVSVSAKPNLALHAASLAVPWLAQVCDPPAAP
jgi:hypothetical protein